MSRDSENLRAEIDSLRRELSRMPVRWGERTIVDPSSATAGTSESCDCFGCVSTSEASIGTCASAPDSAPVNYTFSFVYPEYPDLEGTWTLQYGTRTHTCVSGTPDTVGTSGCVWTSCTIAVSTGVYQWKIDMAASPYPTLSLVFLSGTDVGLDGTLVFQSDAFFDARCTSKFQITNPHLVDTPAGMSCIVCIAPSADAVCCCNCFTFTETTPALTVGAFSNSGGSVTFNLTTTSKKCTSFSVGSPCLWTSGSPTAFPNYGWTAKLTYGSFGTVSVTIDCQNGGGTNVSSLLYECTNFSCAGPNTFTYISTTGAAWSSPSAPSTITVNALAC